MVLLVASLLLLQTPITVPARASRAAFAQAMSQVRDDWTKEQVLKLLGKPDDIWPPNDSSNYVMAGDEAWCYGTNGHHTLPTLGRVTFRRGKVLQAVGGEPAPPAPSVIGESELVKHMRAMHRPERSRFSDSDPLRLVQVANDLMPLGKQKAVAVMREYARVSGRDDTWMFWLARVMFTSSRPGGVFRVPRIGGIVPPPPKDLTKWPTFPIVIVDDVPISLFRGAVLAGFPEPFGWYLKEHEKEWTLRTRRLTPPDDPFLSYKKLVGTDRWPLRRVDPTKTGRIIPFAESEGYALKEVLTLVRTAYRPPGMDQGSYPYINGLDYDRYHDAFLKLGCRWNDARQVYVRRDGSFTPDKVEEYPQHVYRFKGLPGLEVSVTLGRTDTRSVDYSIEWIESGKANVPTAVIVFMDADKGHELASTVINVPEPHRSREISRERALALPPHPPMQGHAFIGSGFDLPVGRPVRCTVLMAGKRYASDLIKP
jgi:hypothetical protein